MYKYETYSQATEQKYQQNAMRGCRCGVNLSINVIKVSLTLE